MTRQWQVVSPNEAKDHPLYGIKNWLAVFTFGVLLGVLRDLVSLDEQAHKAGLTLGQLFAIEHPAVTFTKVALFLEVGVVAIIYWLLITKHQNFRQLSTALLLISWPAAALLSLANPFQGLGQALAISFFSWALSSAIWVTYLQRSKRVRITFEHCILSAETGVSRPANQEASFPSSSGATLPPANLKPQQQEPPSPSLHKADVPRILVSSPSKESSYATKPTMPSEESWSTAISEFDSTARRAGLWAMMFSEAEGNESIAKAGYLRHRAAELHRDHTARLEEEAQRAVAQARDAALAALSSQQREYAELPKGLCPNCGDIIPVSNHTCPECKAMFGPLSAWTVTPLNEVEEVEALRSSFVAGKKPTSRQVIFLTAASNQDRSLTTLADNTVRGDTLLHWCAQFGLANEATTLIANGANPSVTNSAGKKPFEVCIDMNLRGLLRSASCAGEI